ncbi:hypothetical protein Hanom_Chr07g00586301 [Helianthus anomalus]
MLMYVYCPLRLLSKGYGLGPSPALYTISMGVLASCTSSPRRRCRPSLFFCYNKTLFKGHP